MQSRMKKTQEVHDAFMTDVIGNCENHVKRKSVGYEVKVQAPRQRMFLNDMEKRAFLTSYVLINHLFVCQTVLNGTTLLKEFCSLKKGEATPKFPIANSNQCYFKKSSTYNF